MKLTRNQFLKLFVPTMLWVVFSKWIAACSNDTGSDNDGGDNGGDGGTSEPDCLNAGTNVAISANHGHALAVPKSDVAAGVEQIYEIQGSAGHGHTVTLTPTHFSNLANNIQIVVQSSPPDGGGHTHNITVTCKLA